MNRKLILEFPRFVTFGANLAQFMSKSDIHAAGVEVSPPKPGMSNLPSKLGHIGPKWDKSGTF